MRVAALGRPPHQRSPQRLQPLRRRRLVGDGDEVPEDSALDRVLRVEREESLEEAPDLSANEGPSGGGGSDRSLSCVFVYGRIIGSQPSSTVFYGCRDEAGVPF